MRRLFAVLAVAIALVPASFADTLNSRSAETRLTLGYRVANDAIQALLPSGWTLNDRGPDTPNLSVTLTDRALYEDAQARPIAGGRTRDVIFTSSASNAAKETRTFVILTISPERATPGPYGVSIPATFETRSATVTGADDKPKSELQWSVKTVEGGALDILVRYIRGAVSRSRSPEAGVRVWSAKTPDFYRIYKTESGSDPISTPADRSRLETATLKAAGPRLAKLFDGSERLITVTETPFYLREVWLPER
jgi:hypothetical protein